MAPIGVIGAGAFGTAMACVLTRAGHDVRLWAVEPEVADGINRDRVNPLFLRDLRLPRGITATNDIEFAAAESEFLLLAPPAQHMRSVARRLRPFLKDQTPVVSCAKGMEIDSTTLLPDVLAAELRSAVVCVLSGPSLAGEVAADLPAGVDLACRDFEVAARLARAIANPRFRVEASDDVTGVYLGGVLKNVIGIACGIALGSRLGSNARATLLTYGLAESIRLGRVLGARESTFLGLSGIGDLDLCCNSPQSRNMALGIALGEGRALADILGGRAVVHEGMNSARAVALLAAELSVEVPIVATVADVLETGAGAPAAVRDLLRRLIVNESVSTPRIASAR